MYDLRQEESYPDCGFMQMQRCVLPYLQHLHNARELSSNRQPCNSNLGSESIRIFRKRNDDRGSREVLHLPRHEPPYECDTVVKE
jgi:hypothetical protein